MRLLGSLFKRREPSAEQEQAATAACPHSTLIPRWDSLEDMGKPEKVAQYTCESCGSTFSRQEGERIMSGQAQRLRLDEIERLKQKREESRRVA